MRACGFLQIAVLCKMLLSTFASCPLKSFEEKKRFANHTFIILTDVGPNMCEDACLRMKDCKSFNYNLWKFRCELNFERLDANPSAASEIFGHFVYGEKDTRKLKEPCASSRCAVHEECVVTTPLTHACIKTACASPQNIPNSKPWATTPLRNIGGSVSHTCQSGYKMVGTAQSICQPSGTWSATGTCEYDCGAPSGVSNAQVSYSSTMKNSVATYNCKTSYVLSGNPDIICNEGGWSTPQCTCTYDCGTPPSLQNATFTYSSSLLGSKASYQCVSSYALVGSTTSTCESEGWSNETMECVFDCGSPPSLQNGQATYSSTLIDSIATYSCNVNYAPMGSPSITCLQSGWQTPQMTCVVDCGTPPVLQNAQTSYTSTTTGSTASYTCHNNYVMSGTSTVTCLSTGWSNQQATCLRDCGDPSSTVANADLGSGSTIEGDQLTYTCRSGYAASNTDTSITCQATGLWSSPNFQCNDKCPSGWIKDTHYSTCYRYFQTWKVYSTAVTACAAYASHLIELQTVGKRNAVFQYLSGVVHHNEFYIGGYKNSSGWYWQSDGRTINSAIWKDDEPKANKRCSFIHHEKDVKATGCNEYFYYICEIPW